MCIFRHTHLFILYFISWFTVRIVKNILYLIYIDIDVCMYLEHCLQVMPVGPHGCLVPVALHVDRMGLL